MQPSSKVERWGRRAEGILLNMTSEICEHFDIENMKKNCATYLVIDYINDNKQRASNKKKRKQDSDKINRDIHTKTHSHTHTHMLTHSPSEWQCDNNGSRDKQIPCHTDANWIKSKQQQKMRTNKKTLLNNKIEDISAMSDNNTNNDSYSDTFKSDQQTLNYTNVNKYSCFCFWFLVFQGKWFNWKLIWNVL